MTQDALVESSPGSPAPVRAGRKSAEQLSYAVPAADRDEFESLPYSMREEISLVLSLSKAVAASTCRKRAFAAHASRRRGFGPKSLKRKFHAYLNSGGDWRVFKNENRLRENRRLPAEFVAFVQGQFLRNKRVSRQGWLNLRRFWEQGCDDKGKPFVVPGYGTWQDQWAAEHPSKPLPERCPGLPRGWSYENLMRKCNRLTRAQEVMAREGLAAARTHTPHVLGTRTGLRFLEQVTFDDVKVDFRVLDPVSGQVCDLWLLVAFDRASAVCLGYGMRPARAREDGSQEHLKLIDMKQLCGWVLERWGLPPYPITWKLENGCATLPEATALALSDLSAGRISVSYAELVTGKSAAGYRERAIGNSRAKASHESHNNLLHNMAGDLPGQTGRRYDVRPADLAARESETLRTWSLSGQLSAERRGAMQYPILTVGQAREELNAIFHRMNSRTLHELEGFEEIILCRPGPEVIWKPVSVVAAVQGDIPANWEFTARKESPYERMSRLVAGLEWASVPRSVLVHFYQATQKVVKVNARGEISFTHEKRDHVFAPAADGRTYREGDAFLAYYHPRELDFLHLTQLPPHSGYVSTWARRDRVRVGDAKALSEALEYTRGALAAQREQLHEVCKAEAAQLRDVRENNARLVADEQSDRAAIEVQDMHQIAPVSKADASAPRSITATGLDAADAGIQAARRREARAQAAEARESLETLLPQTNRDREAVEDLSGEDLLDALAAT